MRRLGMRFYRAVHYPLGKGFEYALTRADPAPKPQPALLAIRCIPFRARGVAGATACATASNGVATRCASIF